MSLQDQMSATRRINPLNAPDKGHEKLKNVAGLIRNLSYREMQQLSGLIEEEFGDDPSDAREIAEALLVVSDKILGGGL